ncbi:hypothetical protein D3C72_1604680 [compost metagenome]
MRPGASSTIYSRLIQQAQRALQSITTPAHFVDRQIELRLQLLQLLPDGTPAHTQRDAQILPRMEAPILQKFQKSQHMLGPAHNEAGIISMHTRVA